MPNWKRKLSETTIEIPAIEVEKSNEKEVSLSPISGNKLYFYSDVTRESIYNLNRQIDELTKHLKSVQFNYGLAKPPNIELYISSDGGEVFSALSTVDRIINNPIPIFTYNEGLVASAASLLSVVGKKRFITNNGCMLIHAVSGALWGNFMALCEEMKNLELIMQMIKKIYLKYTKFKEAELDDLLKHDLCLTAEECLKHGLVDEIK